MYSGEIPVDGARLRAWATGDVEVKPDWQETPNGRRPVPGSVLLDEQGRPISAVGALFGIGRDGAKVMGSVDVHSHDDVELEEFTPIEFVGLTVFVRPPKSGKGVEAFWSAEGVRPADGTSTKTQVRKTEDSSVRKTEDASGRKSEDTAPKDVA